MSLKLRVETGPARDGGRDGDSGNPIRAAAAAAANRGAIRFVCRRRRRCITNDEMSEIGKR